MKVGDTINVVVEFVSESVITVCYENEVCFRGVLLLVGKGPEKSKSTGPINDDIFEQWKKSKLTEPETKPDEPLNLDAVSSLVLRETYFQKADLARAESANGSPLINSLSAKKAIRIPKKPFNVIRLRPNTGFCLKCLNAGRVSGASPEPQQPPQQQQQRKFKSTSMKRIPVVAHFQKTKAASSFTHKKGAAHFSSDMSRVAASGPRLNSTKPPSLPKESAEICVKVEPSKRTLPNNTSTSKLSDAKAQCKNEETAATDISFQSDISSDSAQLAKPGLTDSTVKIESITTTTSTSVNTIPILKISFGKKKKQTMTIIPVDNTETKQKSTEAVVGTKDSLTVAEPICASRRISDSDDDADFSIRPLVIAEPAETPVIASCSSQPDNSTIADSQHRKKQKHKQKLKLSDENSSKQVALTSADEVSLSETTQETWPDNPYNLKAGDLVWGKMTSYPWWPAIIYTIYSLEVSPIEQSCCVTWIDNGNEYGFVDVRYDVEPFEALFAKRYNAKRTTLGYQKSVARAISKTFRDGQQISADSFFLQHISKDCRKQLNLLMGCVLPEVSSSSVNRGRSRKGGKSLNSKAKSRLSQPQPPDALPSVSALSSSAVCNELPNALDNIEANVEPVSSCPDTAVSEDPIIFDNVLSQLKQFELACSYSSLQV